MLRLCVVFQPPDSAVVLGYSLGTCTECLASCLSPPAACSIFVEPSQTAEEKQAHKTAASARCISAQYLVLVLMQKMSVVRQEKCKTAVSTDFPSFIPFPSSILPRFWFALHMCYELALQKPMVTGRR